MSKKNVRFSNLPTLKTDVFLIGGGIMSTTLGVLIKKIHPNYKVMMSERLSEVGLESSDALNNAGTGHAGYCELQYTPMNKDTHIIDKTKALKVNEAFSKSIEFWKYLIESGEINPDFLHQIPHYSFVSGQEDVFYLSLRYASLRNEKAFQHIKFSKDFDEISKWLPLITQGRDRFKPIAATKADNGFDVDFGRLSRYLSKYLSEKEVKISFNEEVIDLYQEKDKWYVVQMNLITKIITRIETSFVFIGAGGAAINLLKKADIPETKHYGGFPISGQWLICHNEEVVKQHHAKVYTRPNEGLPQMVSPHFDTRIINGKTCLLFGPYAGATTKFLKYGSYSDFFKSIKLGNIGTMLDAGFRNIPMTKFLISEVVKNKKEKFEVLKTFYPTARFDDWDLTIAGQRVQVIKEVNGKGIIEFGTEVVTNEDKSLACLLGASPGASTSVSIILDLLDKCGLLGLKEIEKIKEMIPSYERA